MSLVTVGILVYRSPAWLSFVLEGLSRAQNATDWVPLVLANDPTPEIARDTRVDQIFRNADPEEYYINRVYRAWNRCVELAKTEYVVLINSDMYVSDGWLDALMDHKEKLPTSLLVESGAILSAMPEYVCDLGRYPSNFDRELWKEFATCLRSEDVSPGRLFMPVLFRRQEFLDAGGYPEGNVGEESGDKVFFDKLTTLTGRPHLTVHGSVVYHVQEGEMRSE